MKNFILPILIFFCLFLGFVFVLVNTPFLVNAMIPKLVNDHAKDFQIEEFKCLSQKSRLPDALTMKNVVMKIRRGDRVFDVKANEVNIHNFLEFVKRFELLRISANGVDLKTERVSAKGGQLKAVVGLNDWNITFIEGAGFSKEFEVGPYVFKKISGHLKVNPKKIEVFDIKGSAYEGRVKGQLNFDYKPQFSYVVWSEFDGIHAQSVVYPYPDFFSSLLGTVSGSVRVVGSEQVDIFTVILKGSKSLTISPGVFLKMDGAFDDEETAELKRLGDSGAVLKTEKSMLHVQNSRGHKIMLVFDIKESEEGLLLKGKFPFSWEEGFESFLFPIKKP